MGWIRIRKIESWIRIRNKSFRIRNIGSKSAHPQAKIEHFVRYFDNILLPAVAFFVILCFGT